LAIPAVCVSAYQTVAVEELVLSDQAARLVNDIDNRVLREMTLDYFRMTHLRSDIFQRGIRPIRAGELLDRLGALHFLPIADPEQTSMVVNTHHGKVSLNIAKAGEMSREHLPMLQGLGVAD